MRQGDVWFLGEEVKGHYGVEGANALADRNLIGCSDIRRHMDHTARLPARVPPAGALLLIPSPERERCLLLRHPRCPCHLAVGWYEPPPPHHPDPPPRLNGTLWAYPDEGQQASGG